MQVKQSLLLFRPAQETNFAMRGAQFLEALHHNQALFEKGRAQANAWEIISGMHHWLRQVGVHAALYRFWKAKNIEAAGSLRPEQAFVQSLGGGAAPEQRRGERLQDLDRVKFLLMTHDKFIAGQVHRTSDMRYWFGGKLKHVYSNQATKVQEAAEGLELLWPHREC